MKGKERGFLEGCADCLNEFAICRSKSLHSAPPPDVNEMPIGRGSCCTTWRIDPAGELTLHIRTAHQWTDRWTPRA